MANNEVTVSEAVFHQDPETGNIEIHLPAICDPKNPDFDIRDKILSMTDQMQEKSGQFALVCDP